MMTIIIIIIKAYVAGLCRGVRSDAVHVLVSRVHSVDLHVEL